VLHRGAQGGGTAGSQTGAREERGSRHAQGRRPGQGGNQRTQPR